MSKIELKNKVLTDYMESVDYEEFKEKTYTIRKASHGCSWCERFKEAEFLYCLNCGGRVN